MCTWAIAIIRWHTARHCKALVFNVCSLSTHTNAHTRNYVRQERESRHILKVRRRWQRTYFLTSSRYFLFTVLIYVLFILLLLLSYFGFVIIWRCCTFGVLWICVCVCVSVRSVHDTKPEIVYRKRRMKKKEEKQKTWKSWSFRILMDN